MKSGHFIFHLCWWKNVWMGKLFEKSKIVLHLRAFFLISTYVFNKYLCWNEKKCSKVQQYNLTFFRKFSRPNIFSPTQMKKKCSDFMFFTYVSEKMSHLHIHLQLDTFSNFYFTFDISKIFFWAIVFCLLPGPA